MDIVIKDRTFDSGRAANFNSNEPVIELQTSISNVVGVCLMSANVPFTYYVFDSTNNTFVLQGTTVTIKPQSCKDTEWPAVVLSAITDAGVSGASDYEAFVDTTTNQFVLYNTASTSFTMNFTAATAATDQLGFGVASYSSVTCGSVNLKGNDEVAINSAYTCIVSPYTCNFSGPSQMYLHGRILGPAMNGSVTNDSNASDIIGDFRVNVNYKGTITYENQTPVPYSAQISSVKKVSLYLTLGSSMVPVDLRGSKWQVKIRFFCRKTQVDSAGPDLAGNNVLSVIGGGRPQVRSGVPNKRKVFG